MAGWLTVQLFNTVEDTLPHLVKKIIITIINIFLKKRFCVCLQHFSSAVDSKLSIFRYLTEETHFFARRETPEDSELSLCAFSTLAV